MDANETSETLERARIVANGTKSSPTAKVGVGFRSQDDKVFVTHIKETSIFYKSELEAGHEVLYVNGRDVSGMDAVDIKNFIASISREVSITAQPSSEYKNVIGFKIARRIDDTKSFWFDAASFHRPSSMPPMLEDSGVPQKDFDEILDSMESEWLPAVSSCLKIDDMYIQKMSHYTSDQMFKGSVGFGLESSHEQKVIMMTSQLAILHSNVSMTATNVLMEVNALLNYPYRIKAKLAFRVTELSKVSRKQDSKYTVMIPIALEFTTLAKM